MNKTEFVEEFIPLVVWEELFHDAYGLYSGKIEKVIENHWIFKAFKIMVGGEEPNRGHLEQLPQTILDLASQKRLGPHLVVIKQGRVRELFWTDL